MITGGICFTVWFRVDSMTMPQSLRSLLEHFNKTRNVEVNPSAKQKARDFIVKTFNNHGLRTWAEEFPSNNAQVNQRGVSQVCYVDGTKKRLGWVRMRD